MVKKGFMKEVYLRWVTEVRRKEGDTMKRVRQIGVHDLIREL